MIKIPQLHLKLYSIYSIKVKLKKWKLHGFFAAQAERNAESKQKKKHIDMHLAKCFSHSKMPLVQRETRVMICHTTDRKKMRVIR